MQKISEFCEFQTRRTHKSRSMEEMACENHFYQLKELRFTVVKQPKAVEINGLYFQVLGSTIGISFDHAIVIAAIDCLTNVVAELYTTSYFCHLRCHKYLARAHAMETSVLRGSTVEKNLHRSRSHFQRPHTLSADG